MVALGVLLKKCFVIDSIDTIGKELKQEKHKRKEMTERRRSQMWQVQDPGQLIGRQRSLAWIQHHEQRLCRERVRQIALGLE